MEQSLSALESLKNSVYQLMDKCSQLESQNKHLSNELTILNTKITNKQAEIEELNEKYNVLKIAKSLEGASSENKEVKLKINEMVREIDKCIALLNK